NMLELLDGCDFQVTTVTGGKEALQMLRERRIDCMVLDTALPDMTLPGFAEELRQEPELAQLPIVVYSKETLSGEAEADVKALAQANTVRQVYSPERLLDQTAFFLHYPVERLPQRRRNVLQQLYQTDKVLAGKKVLIVDDDIRNIFALS